MPDISAASAPAPIYSLSQLTAYALKLGTFGFGGPVALVGYMHRDLVERRGWISEAEYKEGLALAQLMPGPLAAQLAIYLGYVHYGVLGATLIGVGFVLPSFLMVLAIGWAYRAYGGLPWMQAVFFGIGPAVIAIILISAYKLTLKTIGKDALLAAIFVVSLATTVVTQSEIAWLFLGAGVVAWLVKTPRPTRGPINDSTPPPMTGGQALIALPLLAFSTTTQPAAGILWKIAVYFAEAGAFVFGSGLAIVPFLYGGVVKEYGWLTEQQFLDAVAVAMITPGPVVITVAFIGFLVAGLAGAIVAALATFLPCYLLTIIPAPYFKMHGKRPGIVAFVDGVTAAAVGAIAGAVIVLGQRTLMHDPWRPSQLKWLVFAATLAVLLRFRKLPEPVIILAAAAAGLVLFPFAER
jgi:chromate transporter